MKRKLIIATFLMALCASRLGANVDWPEWGVAVLEVGSSADARQEQQALRNSLEVVGIPTLPRRM